MRFGGTNPSREEFDSIDEPMVPTPWTQYVQLNAERTAALKGGAVDANLTRKLEPKMGPGCKR